MANEKHLAILREGVDAWNEWREQNRGIIPDLIAANLVRADLGKANLFRANLTEAYLREANLTDADLRGAHFSAADLSDADFSEALLGWTILADVDLSTAKGLETVRHDGPSTIGVDTIYRSQGKIPEVFLRGAGLPDEFIAYIGSLVGRPIEFYSCFVSYSGKDQEFADRLYEGLQNKGVRCWFAPHDIQGGRKVYEQLDEAIRVHDKLLLILSEHSMNSDWVGTEIANAREREARERKQMLFPVTIVPFERVRSWKLFDADRGKDSAREIR
ncbi:MAG: toll/interleukin-1 receptor domain-containing protein [Candidatus Korobacteraceae bacterium]